MDPSYSTSSRGLLREIWTKISPYAKEPIAAGCAIVPFFYGFILKSTQQLGQPMPKMGPVEVLKQGIKAAPTIGFIVGTQTAVQSIVERLLFGKRESSCFSSMLTSSVIVGFFSAPALAVLNGQTMGYSIKASLQSLSKQQTMAIVIRETSFLFSLRISTPVSEAMKKIFGDNKAVDYGSASISGAIGSLIGHPADTALTLWQKNKKVIWRKRWNTKRRLAYALRMMKGAPAKALSVGGFATGYKWVKSKLED